MARNEEKQLARLNRLLLERQHDEERRKHPARPHLSSLNSAADIKKWLPSIKRDLEFNLQQMQVPCYPERKIDEFKVCISHLKGEYKAFIKKLKQFDVSSTTFQEPWTDRPYHAPSNKRVLCEAEEAVSLKKCWRGDSAVKTHDEDNAKETKTSQLTIKRLDLPVLDGDLEELYKADSKQAEIIWNCDPHNLDDRLEFSTRNVEATISEKEQTLQSDINQDTDKSKAGSHESTSNCKNEPRKNAPLGSLVEYSSSDSDSGG